MKRTVKFGIITIGIILIGFFLRGKITNEKFDSEKWKNWEESEAEWSMRWEMMNNLRDNHELKGMTKTEIIELLGKPTSQNNSVFTYNLGPSKRGINYGYLKIFYNKNAIVTNFKVIDS